MSDGSSEKVDTAVDYYSLLGIKRRATASEIKSAYRKLVFRYHPDRNPDDDGAVAKLAQVLEAYETLSDAAKRAVYDEATRSFSEEEPQEQEANDHGEKVHDPSEDGFHFSQDFKAKTGPEPKCPGCSVAGSDYIISRKGGSGTARGKQFILAPFNIIFCSECGHVYGVTATSS